MRRSSPADIAVLEQTSTAASDKRPNIMALRALPLNVRSPGFQIPDKLLSSLAGFCGKRHQFGVGPIVENWSMPKRSIATSTASLNGVCFLHSSREFLVEHRDSHEHDAKHGQGQHARQPLQVFEVY